MTFIALFLGQKVITMKNKLFTFIKMFYDNTVLLRAWKAGILLTALVLFINVSLVSAPNYVGYMNGVDSIHQLHGIDEAFADMYEDELDCRVEDARMQCDLDEARTYGDYTVRFTEAYDLQEVDEPSIILTPDEAAVVYHGEGRTVVEGDYTLLSNFDFSTVKSDAEDADSKADYYGDSTNFFLKNLYYSELEETVGLVYTVQFGQTLMYAVFVSLMIMTVNFKASIKKITYNASLRITIFAMTGPALLAAVLGLWISSWAYMLFTVIYLARIIVLFYKINRSDYTIGSDDPPEPDPEDTGLNL